jgi:uncharacterized Zn-finger protein
LNSNVEKKFLNKHFFEISKYLFQNVFPIMIGPSEFGCPFCERITKTKQNMQTHIRSHTGEKPYGCQYCDSAFTSKSHLNRHTLLHKGEKPFNCNFCDFKSNQKESLKSHHIRRHQYFN